MAMQTPVAAPSRAEPRIPSRETVPQQFSHAPPGATLARTLGWFSIGLGVAEILAPRSVSRAIGVEPHPILMPMYGLREIVAGVGLLSKRRPVEWVVARIAGDAIDMASLAAAAPSCRTERGRLAAASLAVAGVTLLDVYCLQQLTQRRKLSARAAQRGVRVQRSITVNLPREQVYAFWRNFSNFPQFMHYIESVEQLAENETRWTAKGPAGAQVTWNAIVTEDVPSERIAWRSLPDSQVETHGCVEFHDAPAGRGTEVRVRLVYNPPGGSLGAAVARLFGRSAEQEIREDLRRFKRLIETGEIPTTANQPRGKCLR